MKAYRVTYTMVNYHASRHPHGSARKISDDGDSSTYELKRGLTKEEARKEIERIAKQWLYSQNYTCLSFGNWGIFCANLKRGCVDATADAGTFKDGCRWFSEDVTRYGMSEYEMGSEEE